jgi:hypothetical protein
LKTSAAQFDPLIAVLEKMAQYINDGWMIIESSRAGKQWKYAD